MNSTKRSQKSFKSIIMLIIILCATIPMLISSAVSYKLSLTTNEEEYDNRLTSEILKIDTLINNYFETIVNSCNGYAKYALFSDLNTQITSYIDLKANTSKGKVKMDITKANAYEKEVYNYFQTIVDNNPDIISLTIGAEENGGILIYPVSDRSPGYDARTRGWYKTAKNSNKDTTTTDVYLSSNGKKSIEIVTRLLDKNKNFKGAITASVPLNGITSIIEAETIGKTGKIIIIDRNGLIVSNPLDKSLESKKIDALNIPELQDMSKIAYEQNIKKDGKIIRPVKSPNAIGFTYLSVIDESEISSQINKILFPSSSCSSSS